MNIADVRIDIKQYIANTKAKSRINDELRRDCQICGKAVNVETCKVWIHLSVSGELLDPLKSSEEIGLDSMGFFPIGSSCKNWIPIDYRSEQ